MRHAIDPKIDCVFKALLGSEENRNLLIHFLNAFLAQDLIEPLVWVEILNPYNDKEFLSDKLSIVDVKARDCHDRLYQIEIQLTSYGHLPARIIYNWADTVSNLKVVKIIWNSGRLIQSGYWQKIYLPTTMRRCIITKCVTNKAIP